MRSRPFRRPSATISRGWNGQASGPIGAEFDVNIPSGYGSLDCGGWTAFERAGLKACKRDSDSQSENISYQAERIPTFFNYVNCYCPAMESSDSTFLSEISAGNSNETVEKKYSCPE